MATLGVAVGTAPVDISTSLSVAMAAANPVGSMASRGRGRARLFNSAGNASLYVLIGPAAPDGAAPPIRVRSGEWFPEDLDVRPAADGGDRVWCWASRNDVTCTALVVRWS